MKKEPFSPRRKTPSEKPDLPLSSDSKSSPRRIQTSPRAETSPRKAGATSPRKGLLGALSPRKKAQPEVMVPEESAEPIKSLNLLERVYTARSLLQKRSSSLQGKPATCMRARAEIHTVLYDLKAMGLHTQAMQDLESIAIVPFCDLFSESMLEEIGHESKLDQNSQALKSLNELIYKLQTILGEFKFEDEGEKKDFKRIYDPLKTLCDYYLEKRDLIIHAESPQERLAIVSVEEAYIFSDSFDVCELDQGSFSSSGERSLVILTRNKDAIEIRGAGEGTRTVYIDDLLVMKANPIRKNYNDPEAEKSVGSWYQLHCPIPHLEEANPVLVSAPSESAKILHAPLNPAAALNPEISALVVDYLHQKKQERMVQLGYRFYGTDFHIVLHMLSTLHSWKTYIKKEDLVAHLTALEKIYSADILFQEDVNLRPLSYEEKIEQLKLRPLLNINNWPAALLLHSDTFIDQFIKLFLQTDLTTLALSENPSLFIETSDIDADELTKLREGNKAAWHNFLSKNIKALNILIKKYPQEFFNFILEKPEFFKKPLSDSLAKFPKAMHEKIRNYTPEAIWSDFRDILQGLDKGFYSRFCISNIPIDPWDLTAVNLSHITRLASRDVIIHYLSTFDADSALEYPVTRLTNPHDGSTLHYPTSKCLLFFLPQFEDAIDGDFREEFLTHTPLNYLLDWCELLLEFDHKKREHIVKQLITEKDVYEKTESTENTESIENRVEAVLKNRKRILFEPNTSLRIPQTLTPDRLPSMLESYEKLEEAMIVNPSLSHLQALQTMRPASAAYLQRVCFPKLRSENPYRGILEALDIIASKSAPSFEHAFLGDRITALVKETLGDKFKPEYMDAISQYNILVAKQNASETPQDNPLPSMETLRKECKIPELNGISLHDLLEKHHHKSGDHIANATVAVKEAIKLFIEKIDFREKYYKKKKTKLLLYYLNRIGLKFPFVKLNCFTNEESEHLLFLSAKSALPGAIHLLINNNNVNIFNGAGETTLHTLLQNHRFNQITQVIDSLKHCLTMHADPDQLDKLGKSPLMRFIENADPNNPEPAKEIIKLLRKHRLNLNQRISFQKKHYANSVNRNEHIIGTLIDFAINCDNPAAVLSLLENGATDFVDMDAALAFIETYKTHGLYKSCVKYLIHHPRFAYTLAINELSSPQPDDIHPSHCLLQGTRHEKRYFLKQVWDQMFDENGEIKRENTLSSGTHIVIPLSKESYEFCIWSTLPNNDPINAQPNKIYVSEDMRYCVINPEGILEQDRLDIDPSFDFKKFYTLLRKTKKLYHEARVSKKQFEYKILSVLSEKSHIHPFILHVKFFPEFPLVQRLVELMNERLGCPSIHSEVWRSNTIDGKQTFPLQISNTLHGDSFRKIDSDTDKLAEFQHALDRRVFSLQAIITLLTSQEDGHPDQYKAINRPNGNQLQNIDPDRACGPRLIWEEGQRKILNKDVFFLIPAFSEIPLDPDAIFTIICANGKRLPEIAPDELNVDILIRENAGLFFDGIFHEVLEEEQRLLTLFPRDSLCKGVTFTTAELIERDKKDPLPSSLRNAFDQLDKPEKQQEEKAKMPKKKSIFSLIKSRNEQFTVIDCPFEIRTFSELYELYVKIAKFLYLNAQTVIYPTRVFREMFPELFHLYNTTIKKHPNLSACQKYLQIADGKQKTTLTQKDVIECASQNLSTKFKRGKFCNSVGSLVEFYYQSKKRAAEVLVVTHKIDINEIPTIKTFRTEKQFEDFIRCIHWGEDKRRNKQMLSAIHEVQKSNQYQLKYLYLCNCQDLSWDDIKHFLQYSPQLETLELINCSGLRNALGKSIVNLLEEYSPTIKRLILVKTDANHFDYDGSKLSSLYHVEVQQCLQLRSARLMNSQLMYLNFSGSENLEDFLFTYTREFSLNSPLSEERPLQELVLNDCCALTAECIESILDASPFLQRIAHKNTTSFNPLAFLSFSLMQNRFCQSTFEVMLQNYKLILPKLIEDHHLIQISDWIKLLGKDCKITEINFSNSTQLSQMAKFRFILGLNTLPRIIEPGSMRTQQTQGPAYEWDIGLSSITAIEELPNGNIFAMGKKSDTTPRAQSMTAYAVRSPERTNINDYVTFGTLEDRRKDGFKGKCVNLNISTDPIASTIMPDGTLFVLDQNNKLLQVDTISQHAIMLTIPFVSSYMGEILSLAQNIFALHSDRFYIIAQRNGNWAIRHKVSDSPVLHPIIKGPTNLVAFCSNEGIKAKLSVMNYHSGITLFSQHFNTQLIKPLCFLNDKEILICSSEFTHEKIVSLGSLQRSTTQHSLAIINIQTCQVTVFNSDFTLSSENIRSITATQLPSGEILISGLGIHDKITLNLTDRYLSNSKTVKQPILSCQNDIITLTRKHRDIMHIEILRNKFHVLEPAFQPEQFQKYDITIITEGEIIVKITAPDPIETPILDINLSSNKAWYETVSANKPTGTTLLDLLSAFFEKIAIKNISERNKQCVTHQDNIILIKGLSETEAQILRQTLKTFWQHPISPTASPRFHRQPSPHRSLNLSVLDETSNTTSQAPYTPLKLE